MNWYQLEIIINREAQEAAGNYLISKGSPGITIEDSSPPSLQEGGDIMYSSRDYSRDSVSIKGYFYIEEKDLDYIIKKLKEFLNTLPHHGIDLAEFLINVEKVEEEDWAESWKEYFHPVKISSSLAIIPSWINYEPREGERVVKLDPGMAFGCGTHPTTRMCLEFLTRESLEGALVYDLGCGSGILSIAAVKLGAKGAVALDNDEKALEVAEENCRGNSVEGQVKIFKGELPHFLRERNDLPRGDIIVANISTEIIIDTLGEIKKICQQKARVILTGIISSKTDLIKERLGKSGYILEEMRHDGDWAAFRCLPGKGKNEVSS